MIQSNVAVSMRSPRRFYQWLVTPPVAVPPGQFRAFGAAAIGYPLAALVHVVFVAYFILFQVPALVVTNALSAAIWLAMIALARRGKLRQSFELGILEAAASVAITVDLVGWDFGMQYYLLAAVIFTFLAPAPVAWAPSICAAAAAEFLALDLWSHGHPPRYVLPVAAIVSIRAFNVLGTFLVAGLVAALFKNSVQSAEASMVEAHGRTEALLHDVLPSAIADRLQDRRQVIADSFAEASILFADIVGFTELSQRVSPASLVELLNSLFTRFDELVVKHRLEKIKTIGDAYMVAAGIPVPRPDHAQAMASLALDMGTAVAAFNRERATDLRVRIGINSGPVVAGVIGKLRFIYDLWGDSVNTASRMESHGLAGEVQVSESTYELIRNEFELEARGTIEVKGKGPMPTWLIRGRKE